MAKIPIILEPGRADGKLATSGAIFDENKGMFQSEINDIQDTLNSNNPNKPLSANQGKILKELLDAKVIEAGAIPIDTEPTEGNTEHIVTSDGIYKSMQASKIRTTTVGFEGTNVQDNLNDASNKISKLHNNAYQLAQGNATDWSKVIVACYVRNWSGGDKRLVMDFCYRNNTNYGSGIRLNICDADLTNEILGAYWSSLSGNRSGLELLSWKSISGGYGEVCVVINWNVIPNGFNSLISPKFYPDLQLIQTEENFTTQLKNLLLGLEDSVNNLENSVKLANYDHNFFNIVGYLRTSDGSLTSKSGWHSTDYIEILSDTDIFTNKLEYDNNYIGFICFYDRNKLFISSLSNVGTFDSYKIKNEDIPSNAVYIRCCTYDNITTTEQSITLIFNYKAVLSYRGEIKQNSENIDILNSKIITKSTRTSGLDDTDYYSSYYSQYGIAEYTKPQQSDFTFNKVVLRGVNLNANNTCVYKLYLYSGVELPSTHTISSNTHTLIKSGVLTKKIGEQFSDFDINLDEFIKVPSSYQVLVYLLGESKISIRGTNSVVPSEELYNFQIFSVSSGDAVWTDNWYSGGSNYAAMSLWLYNNPLFVSSSNLTEQIENIAAPIAQKESERIINNHINYGIQIQLSDTIYAIVGTELNLWHDALCLSVDRGLASPLNYSVQWYCNVGLVTERCFRFTPTSEQAGNNYSLTCYIYNIYGELLTHKTITIKVLAKNVLSARKNIVYFGDSLGSGAATSLYNNFNNTDKFTGTKPTMLGTQSSNSAHFEAIGGYEWSSYATQGEKGFRVPVSRVTSIGLGAIYTDVNNRSFIVKEVNIVDGVGNILLFKHYSPTLYNYGDLALPDGTLTKRSGSGDASVDYVGAYTESTNPLWNNDTNRLDINIYKQKLITLGQLSSLNDKIDAVSFQFGINDRNLASNLPKMMEYIEALYNLFVGDNPDCKFLIGLTTTSGNTLDGAGANYGASWNNVTYAKQVFTIRDFYLSLQNSEDYPNIRICSINPQVDRYYGYSFSTRQISQRNSDTEKYHNNCVHPGSIGYGQMGDAYFAAFVGALTE